MWAVEKNETFNMGGKNGKGGKDTGDKSVLYLGLWQISDAKMLPYTVESMGEVKY